MSITFKERRFPVRGVAVFLIFFICLLGLGGLLQIPGVASFKGDLYLELLERGLGGGGTGDRGGQSLPGGLLLCLTGVDPGYLPDVLGMGLPTAAFGGAATATLSGSASDDPGEHSLSQQGIPEEKTAGYRVAIYHTHNAETYIPLDGKSKVDGRNGGVGRVAEEMVRILEKAGFRALHDLTIHDCPDFPTSYIKSEVTARRLVQENPDLEVLIDLHRDAGLPKKETVKVGGEEVARIMFVVGNGERLSNPHWRENYAFAQTIAHRLEERYPGLVKAVRLKAGRYNQHLSPHALLVEVGSDKNTLEESLGAARCLANVLVELLREEED